MVNCLIDIGSTLLRCFPAEAAHHATIKLLQYDILPPARLSIPPSMHLNLWGKEFESPIGLAAGFDKNAVALNGLYGLGFGFVEAGTVTFFPQAGNPKPRLFRLRRDKALINRLGFNGEGLEAFVENLRSSREQNSTRPLGVNIGLNRDRLDQIGDYTLCIEKLLPFADYIAVNVSSPNTPGLRSLQDSQSLEAMLIPVLDSVRTKGIQVPILLKLSPDLTGDTLHKSVETAVDGGISGFILGNTTTNRPNNLRSSTRHEAGGLSGEPLRQSALTLIRNVYQICDGSLPLIGVGGIASADDAYARLKAGASLIQIYTGFVYQGPRLIQDIISGLALHLENDGFETIAEAVGVDFEHVK